jgi:phosphoglycolate phosphatase
VTPIRAALFDVDGVLVDSVQAHLAICRDKSNQYGLGLRIPTAPELKAMIRRGVIVSPMKQLFLAVGFPEELAIEADADYKREFATKYTRKLYPGVPEMLARLANRGLKLGLVTANTRANIETTLGTSMSEFDPRCVFTVDDGRQMRKAESITLGVSILAVDVTSAIYVGDQLADYDAAKAAGSQFLGVTYGWGISEEDSYIPTARSPGTIADYIIGRSAVG